MDHGRVLERATPEAFFNTPQHPRAQQFLSDMRSPFVTAGATNRTLLCLKSDCTEVGLLTRSSNLELRNRSFRFGQWTFRIGADIQ
jgi:ABC-type dipeptide/oligopeptide/nickel transport system ATPase component